MEIITRQTQKFDPIPGGAWEADITRMFEKKEYNRFDGEEREGIQFEFTLIQPELRGRKAHRFVSPFMTQKSILWAIWSAATRRQPSAEDLAEIHSISDLIDDIAGKPLTIIVKEAKSAKGNVYYKITDFLVSKRDAGEFPFVPGAPEGMENVNVFSASTPTTATETAQPTTPARDAQSIADEMDQEEQARVTKAKPRPVE